MQMTWLLRNLSVPVHVCTACTDSLENPLLAICTKPVEPWWISEKLSKKFSTWKKSANRLIIKLYTKLSTLSTRLSAFGAEQAVFYVNNRCDSI